MSSFLALDVWAKSLASSCQSASFPLWPSMSIQSVSRYDS